MKRSSAWMYNNKRTSPPPPKKPRRQSPPALPQQVAMAAGTALTIPSVGQDHLISNLPDECIYLIFTFLPSPRDRCSCAAVSRKWLLLQSHMRPSDVRSTPSSPTTISSLLEERKDDHHGSRVASSRRLHSHKANDARLAAMAVGTCARGAPTELVITAAHFDVPAPNSSLLIVSDVGLDAISRACQKLRSLVLWNCAQVGNEGLAAVARNCPALEMLDISSAPLVDDGGLVPIALSCPKLSDLRLETCPFVGDGALQTFARFSPHLESITLGSCPLVGDAGLAALFSSLPVLAKVKIAHTKVGDAALGAICDRGAENPIRSVCLEDVTGFTYQGFRRLLTAPNLVSLTVSCCADLNDACFGVGSSSRHIGGSGATQFVGLKDVTVRSCGALTDDGLALLSGAAKQLENLRVEKCHKLTALGVVGAVGNWCGTLRLLSLVKCNGIGTVLLRQKQGPEPVPQYRCHLLRSLSIKSCPGVGDEFLSLMGRVLVRARRIALVGMGSVTDRGLMSLLASMEERDGLQSVDLGGCPGITDWGVAALEGASGGALRRLSLEGCEGVTDCSLRLIGRLCPGLVELDLSGCGRISDGGVAGLLDGEERWSRLEVLSLEGCGGLTDESLGRLEEMVVRGSLAGLNLRHCGGLTRARIDSVRQTLWWCDLIG